MPLDPSIAALLSQVQAGPRERILTADPAELRERERHANAAVAPGTRIGVGSVADDTVPGPAGPVPVRVYRPAGDGASVEGAAATVVFFHGGGWIVGDLDTHDHVARRLCHDLGSVVVAVHYRRLPEHAFPAAFEDCLAAAWWTADHIDRYGGRRDRLALAGDSAGAALAASVALAFRDAGEPLAAQFLAYPATDRSSRDYPSHTENAEGYLLTLQDLRDLTTILLGGDASVATDVRASPLHAVSHEGLAPAVIATAAYDPLRDEGLAYARALQDAGVDVFVRTYGGLVHGFLNMFAVSEGAEAAVTELVRELGARLR
ncbi:alpha/beta hydrolase [Streptomyces sp. NPDC056883]|uniref:alpha/beta hydrolase n=1 Tax=Streptomyces sp. NPDC056883 TaxID=3345959 RepID=UPI0036BA6783